MQSQRSTNPHQQEQGAPSVKQAAIYARSATTSQADPSPLAVQVRACERYCLERGYEIVAHYEDAGASGASPYRDAYTRLLRDVARGLVDVVVCTDAARLGRDAATVQRALTVAATAGVMIDTLDTGPLPPALASRLEEGQP